MGQLLMFCRKQGTLDFGAMDLFIEDILSAIHEHGARAVRVFPPPSQVLLLFCERLANEVVRTTFYASHTPYYALC